MTFKIKCLSFPDRKLLFCVDGTNSDPPVELELNDKKFSYWYSLGAYVEDDPDDDVPF